MQYQLACEAVKNLPAQQEQNSRLAQAKIAEFIKLIGGFGMTADQQIAWDKLLVDVNEPNRLLSTQSEDTFKKTLAAVTLARQILGEAAMRRTAAVNSPVSVKESSISPQLIMPKTNAQSPLFLKNNGMWEPAGQAGSRGYIAATCYTPQKPELFQPFLFDTLLTVIGNTISIQNTPTSSTFMLAPGYMYKCRAEIFLADSCMYNWYANSVPFGSIGMVNYRDKSTVPSTGYIKNDTSEVMLVTLARCIGDEETRAANIIGAYRLGLYVGPTVTIKEIAPL